ncbi:MAG: hypothetical protein JWQ16_2364, partial [Novosphingobium sp.]|nr:hypothetical protein [Novosphingobium sp.]
NGRIARRQLLAGAGIAGLALLVPGWAIAATTSRLDAARRLVRLATSRAFAKLSAPNGFWDSPVARFDLPELFVTGRRPLSPASREQLQRRLNLVAEAGARRAGQVARRTSGVITREDADAIVAGDATAGTSVLRARVGARMINEMIPAIERALRAERDPVVIAAVGKLSGVELRDVAKAVALKADSAIWYQIGAEEGDIRTNPQATGDTVLIGALRK